MGPISDTHDRPYARVRTLVDGGDHRRQAAEPKAEQFEKLGVVLDVGTPGAPDSRAADVASVVRRDDRLRLWYTAFDGHTAGLYCIESSDPADWSGPRRPVLGEGPPGGAGGARDPYALYHQHLWYLWYSAVETPELDAARHASVWCSISSDADRWLGHSVTLEPAGAAQRVAVAEPAIVRDPKRNLWLMVYAASNGTTWRIGLAQSIDLQNWSRVGIIMEAWLPAVGACRYPRLLWLGDRWLLIFTAEVDGRWCVYGSASRDTVWWQTPRRLLESTLASERDGQRAAFPLRVGDDLYLYYGAQADGRWRTHLAVARDLLPAART